MQLNESLQACNYKKGVSGYQISVQLHTKSKYAMEKVIEKS